SVTSGPSTQSDPKGIDKECSTSKNEYLSREEFEYLKALGLIKKDTGINFTQIR
ncbi:45162_t:CDS:1, partial [Gigaspora margarita]